MIKFVRFISGVRNFKICENKVVWFISGCEIKLWRYIINRETEMKKIDAEALWIFVYCNDECRRSKTSGFVIIILLVVGMRKSKKILARQICLAKIFLKKAKISGVILTELSVQYVYCLFKKDPFMDLFLSMPIVRFTLFQ